MPVAAPGATESDIRRRAVDAALICVERHGLAKTTLDDVARQAGCARASLYRHFGGKRQLVAVAVDAEGARIAAVLHAETAVADTLEDAMVAALVGAARVLRGHRALQFLLAHEPATILTWVTFDAGDRFLTETATALAPCFARFLSDERAERAAEWLTRLVLAYAVGPESPRDLTNEDETRSLVRELVLPAFEPALRG